jgi:hypothetical protein
MWVWVEERQRRDEKRCEAKNIACKDTCCKMKVRTASACGSLSISEVATLWKLPVAVRGRWRVSVPATEPSKGVSQGLSTCRTLCEDENRCSRGFKRDCCIHNLPGKAVHNLTPCPTGSRRLNNKPRRQTCKLSESSAMALGLPRVAPCPLCYARFRRAWGVGIPGGVFSAISFLRRVERKAPHRTARAARWHHHAAR